MTFAYIFDFDGVLANTMEAHFTCYEKALAEAGVPIDKEQFYRQAGMTAREQIKYFCEKAGKTPDIEAIYRRKRELFTSHIHLSTPIGCNLQLLALLRRSGVPVAIATGSSRPSVMPVIQRLNIEVDAVVSAEDITRGKPNPDLFLCAAVKLNVAPANCIVIEDSDAGIEAAGRAGMKAMRFYDNHRAD